jgi:hypothetical protein
MRSTDGSVRQDVVGPRPSGGRPHRLLFLSDCYLADDLWAPFHKSLLTHLGPAFGEVLAVRTNCFFQPWTHRPLSTDHLARLRDEVRAFDPDLIFSVNRCGVSRDLLDVAGGRADRISLFVDYYDRLGDEMHDYDGRDFVWITSTGGLYENFLARFASRLTKEQTIATHWCVDHTLFRPGAGRRDTDIVFVGSPFTVRYFAELVETLRDDADNRAAFLAVHERHRSAYIYDWPAALAEHRFDAGRLRPEVAARFRDNRYLQAAVCDQLTAETRTRFLAALAGLDLKVYGGPVGDWVDNIATVDGRLLRHFQFREVGAGEELAGLYRSSRIGVNLQHDHARGHGLSFRAFDTMACETLLLAHADCTRALGELGFVDGQDFAAFATPAELRQKCEHYLADEPGRVAMAASAGLKVRAAHTLAHRLAEVFGRFGSPALESHFRRLSEGDVGKAPSAVPDNVRTLPARMPPSSSSVEGNDQGMAALLAEVAALRSSWAMRIGNWALAPLRPVRRALRRAG